MNAGLLPIKPVARAKQRLAPVLGAARADLVRALVADALDLVSGHGGAAWWVVTNDPWARTEAERRGLPVVEDPGGGLNSALREGVDAVRAAGAASVTVLPADVPLATEGDLQDLLDTGATSDVVIVPASRGGGTNALYVAPPDNLVMRFGPNSMRAHLDDAAARGVRCAILSLPRIALDLDTWSDALEILQRARAGSRTLDLLGELAPRVRAED